MVLDWCVGNKGYGDQWDKQCFLNTYFTIVESNCVCVSIYIMDQWNGEFFQL